MSNQYKESDMDGGRLGRDTDVAQQEAPAPSDIANTKSATPARGRSNKDQLLRQLDQQRSILIRKLAKLDQVAEHVRYSDEWVCELVKEILEQMDRVY